MKTEILKNFYKEYKEYLSATDRTPNTADQYCTYLRKTCSVLNLGEGFIEAIIAISDANVKAALCEFLMAKLSNELKTAKDALSKKHISNYRSAVCALSEFVTRDEEEAKEVVSYLPAVALPYESVYSQKELMGKFKNRLGTQERYYFDDNASFSARVINRIATKNKWKNIYEELVLNTEFLYEPDVNKFFKLKDITSLTIKTDGFVKIEVNNKEYDVYTQAYKDGLFAGFELLRVNSIELVSLDHIHSVHELYPNFLKTHTELLKFSQNVLMHRKACMNMRNDAFATHYYKYIYPNISAKENLLIDEELLLTQAKEFVDELELLIIHRNYNSSKSDN